MTAFKNPLDPENIQIKMAIRRWLIDRFKIDESAKIDIIENQCSEASCVHAETVVTVSNTEGGVLYYKIAKPIVFIRKIDISLMQAVATKPQRHKHQ